MQQIRPNAPERPLVVLGDLLADLTLQIERFPVNPGDLQKLSFVQIGPGGGCNAAILAARLGLPVTCLGEVGNDQFGRIVRTGLAREGINVSGLLATQETRTPVAAVVVDPGAEPAYLGFPGHLTLSALPTGWGRRIRSAKALYADGWAETEGVVTILLRAFETAKSAGAAIFFDPGPGNPALDNSWHVRAAALATVVLANEAEAARLTGRADPADAAHDLLSRGAELAVVKLGPRGCLLARGDELFMAPAYAVPVIDTTGAGDSLAAAVIYGFLRGLDLPVLGALANAAGAAKVQKRGTGHNVPTRAEIKAILNRSAEYAALV